MATCQPGRTCPELGKGISYSTVSLIGNDVIYGIGQCHSGDDRRPRRMGTKCVSVFFTSSLRYTKSEEKWFRMLMVSACGVLVFVAIGMTVVLLLDYFKRKKEREALAEEQVNLEEAFGGTANTPAAVAI